MKHHIFAGHWFSRLSKCVGDTDMYLFYSGDKCGKYNFTFEGAARNMGMKCSFSRNFGGWKTLKWGFGEHCKFIIAFHFCYLVDITFCMTCHIYSWDHALLDSIKVKSFLTLPMTMAFKSEIFVLTTHDIFVVYAGSQALAGTRMALEDQVERLTSLLDRLEKRVGQIYFTIMLHRLVTFRCIWLSPINTDRTFSQKMGPTDSVPVQAVYTEGTNKPVHCVGTHTRIHSWEEKKLLFYIVYAHTPE